MKPTYPIRQRLIAQILLLSLFLQSCLNSSIPSVAPKSDNSVNTDYSAAKMKDGSYNKSQLYNSIILSDDLIEARSDIESALSSEINTKEDLLPSKQIFTEHASSRPIESIDHASNQLVEINQVTNVHSATKQQAITVDKNHQSNESPSLIAKKTPKTVKELEEEGYEKEPITNFQLSPIKTNAFPVTKNLARSNLIEKLTNQVFTAKRGHKVTFDWDAGKYIAMVEEKLSAYTSIKHQLPVYLLPGMSWEKIAAMSGIEQQHYIHIALEKGHVVVGKMGIMGGMWKWEASPFSIQDESSVNVRDSSGRTPLLCAIEKQDLTLVKQLINSGADKHKEDLETGNMPLHLAATKGSLAIVKELINSGANTTYVNKLGYSALQMAVLHDRTDIAEYLISVGIDPNILGNDGSTALHTAITKQNITIIKALVNAGANLYRENFSNLTPIEWAVITGHLEYIPQIFKLSKVNINAINRDGHTHLFRAIQCGNLMLVKTLIEAGADTNIKVTRGKTPLHFAVEQEQVEIIQYLVSCGANKYTPNNIGVTPVQLALQKHNRPCFKHLISVLGINEKDSNGHTLLYGAVSNKDLILTPKLIDCGANVNDKYENGHTLLHIAVEKGNIDIVNILLAAGANSIATNNNLRTPLHLAIIQGSPDLIEVLLMSQSNKNAKDKDGKTPLHLAVQRRNLAIVKRLILEVDKNIKDQAGDTPLHLAVSLEDIAIIRCLVDAGADNQAKNIGGKTPVQLALEKQDEKLVEQLLDVLEVNIHAKDNNGHTLLHHAVLDNNPKLVKQLIHSGADKYAKDNKGNTPFYMAVEQGNVSIAQLLIELGVDKDVKNNQGHTLLHQTVEQGNIRMVELLIKLGLDKEAKNNYGCTPLHVAAEAGNIELIKQLIALGANKDARTQNGYSLLHIAAFNKKLDLVKYLINNKVSLDSQNNDGVTPLQAAIIQADRQSVEIIKCLLAAGANPNIPDNVDGNIALHIAVLKESIEIVKLLIDRGANKNIKNLHGHTPLYLAIMKGDINLVKELIRLDEDRDAKDYNVQSPLHLAVKNKNIEMIKQLIKLGLDKNARDKTGKTALHVAMKKGEELAVTLVKAGGDLHATNIFGLTPIDIASTVGNLRILKKVFKSGADINAKGTYGLTHLHRAVQRNDEKLVKQLIDCGADVEVTDRIGKTPFHYAAEHGYIDIVKQLSSTLKSRNFSLYSLLNWGGNSMVDIADDQGCTPLHLAAEHGHIKTVEFLLHEKADLYAKDKDGLTPLHKALASQQIELIKALLKIPGCSPLECAINHNDISLVKELVAAGIDINTITQAGKSVLYVAFEKGYLDLTQELIRLGAKIDAMDNEGRSLLHYTVINGQIAVTNALLAAGADVHLADIHGFTALHLAAQHNQTEIAKQLIDAGACINARDKQQMTPLHWAARNGHATIGTLLVQAGATLYAFDEQGYTPLYYAMQQGQLKLVKLLAATSEYKIHAKRCAARARKQITMPKSQQNQKSNKRVSPAKRFLKTYPASLDLGERLEFNQKLAPILQKYLPKVSRQLQERVIQYFQNQGSFYPAIFHNYDVQDWVQESLTLDICKDAIANQDEVGFAKFKERLQTATEHYQDEEREKLLMALKEKQLIYQLDLVLISDILTYLTPFKPSQALKFIELSDPAWLSSLRFAWLSEQVKSLRNFTPSQRSQICCAGALLPCKPELIDRFIAGLQSEKDFRNVENFFAFLTKNSIPETILLLAFYQKPKQAGDSILKAWKHYIACELLKNKLEQLYPAHSSSIEKRVATLLHTNWLYEGMAATLDKLLLGARVNATVEAEQFINVLDLLIEYTVAEPICKQIFVEILQQKPSQDWEKEIHPRVIAATFGTSHERTVEEIIDYIVEKAPNTSFANNKEVLQRSYQAVLDAYQDTSILLPENKTVIAKWGKAEIMQWAQQIKGTAALRNMLPNAQAEVLAVVRRAVKLTHGHLPRATQLLSLLIFLNHAPGKGRLAQINTGEGKSLIVAMLAAINALQGKKVDVVTTSTELSIPEVDKQSEFFTMLGLSVGENSKTDQNREIYQRDIVYGTAGSFQGDILRTEFSGQDIRGNRGFGVVIVDEVDSMFFDSRHASIRLSGQTPAMHHLEILLASVYSQVKQVIRHMIEKDGITYYIHEDFEVNGDQITTFSGNPVQMETIENKEEFVSVVTQKHLGKLLRDLQGKERKAWRAHKELSEKIVKKGFKLACEENEEKRKKREEACKRLGEELKNLPWEKEGYFPILEIPTHLKEFARKQIPHWTRSAIQAICFYKKELHYDVVRGRIVPIDYDNTGVLQHNMVWSDGLAQMLQIKEGLRVEPENVSTNFISVPEFFKRYGNSIYGLTGTLGNEPTYQFLSDVYGTDRVIMPPYKHIPIAGNAHSRYICKELPAIIVSDTKGWYEAIVRTNLSKARNQRAVLIICKYIDQVKKIAKQLRAHHDPAKIFTYTGQEEFNKDHIDAGEIIIATNIAGRGTDITTTPEVEKNGGLHVCITFLPDSYRVELQNAGRTARQGKQGSVQIILQDSTASSINELRALRDAREEIAINRAKNDVKDMLFRDQLFGRFCALESALLPTTADCNKIQQSQQLESIFSKELAKLRASGTIERSYEKHIEQIAKHRLRHTLKQQQAGEAILEEKARLILTLEEMKRKLYQEISKEEFYSKFEQEILAKICAKAKGKIPGDIIESFRSRQNYVSNGSELVSKYNWGKSEREGTEERWGIWLHHALHDTPVVGELETHRQFDIFSSELREAAQRDQLIKNPYYYIRKGNGLLAGHNTSLAVKAYNRAIRLDSIHSVNARYNKAWALLKPKDNKDDIRYAKGELKKAKVLLSTHHKPKLISFHAMVGQTEAKPELLEHLQHQVDILIKQESYIDAALKEIKKAQREKWDVKLTEVKTLEQVFEDGEPGEDRSRAIEKAKLNGLTHMFVVTAKQPFPWKSIIALACLGIAQVAAGVLIFACTGGSVGLGLISEGVSDILASIKAGMTGTFSWAQWSMQKAISLAVSIISSGWDSIKEGFKSIKDTVKNVGNVGLGIAKERMKAAGQQALLSLGKGVAKELATCAMNHLSEELVLKNIEGYIEKTITEKLEKKLLKHKLTNQALSLDVKNKNNYWQQIIIQEGIAILNKPDGKLATLVKGIANGLAGHGINKLGKVLSANAGEGVSVELLQQVFTKGKMAKTLLDILTMTDDFWREFSHKIKDKYKQQIEEAIKAQSEKEKQVEKVEKEESKLGDVVEFSSPPVIEDGEIEVTRLGSGVHHTTEVVKTESQLREYYYGASSSRGSLTQVFAGNLKGKISNKIQGELVAPVTSGIASWGVEKLSAGLTADVNAALEGFKAEGKVHRLGNELARTEQNEKEAKEVEAREEKLDPYSEKKRKAIERGKRGDITDVALLAKTIKRPIIIYKEGKVFDIIGKDLPGEPIALGYTASERGHWSPRNASIEVKVSGLDNCLYDSVAAQLSHEERSKLGIENGQDLRPHVVREIQTNPSISQKFMSQAAELSYLKPAAMMVGGRGFRVNRTGVLNQQTDKYEFAGGHAITEISDEGGEKTDYFYIGDTNEKGEFVEDPDLKVASEREEGKTHSFRIMQDEEGKGIASTFIALNKEGKQVKGYFVERAATAAPAGQYNLILSRTRPGYENIKLNYPNNYVFYNQALKITPDRAFTIHKGNFFDDSIGCLLPGTELVLATNKIFKQKITTNNVGTIATLDSDNKRKALEELISTSLEPNPKVTLNIHNTHKNKGKEKDETTKD